MRGVCGEPTEAGLTPCPPDSACVDVSAIDPARRAICIEGDPANAVYCPGGGVVELDDRHPAHARCVPPSK